MRGRKKKKGRKGKMRQSVHFMLTNGRWRRGRKRIRNKVSHSQLLAERSEVKSRLQYPSLDRDQQLVEKGRRAAGVSDPED